MTPLQTSDTAALNNLEATSIKALVAYTAYERHISEESVREIFSRHFGIKTPEELPSSSYDDAIRFLIEIHPQIVN